MAFSQLNLFATYNIITNVATLVHEGLALPLPLRAPCPCWKEIAWCSAPLPGTFYDLCVGLEKVPRPFRAASQFLEQVKRMQISYSFP